MCVIISQQFHREGFFIHTILLVLLCRFIGAVIIPLSGSILSYPLQSLSIGPWRTSRHAGCALESLLGIAKKCFRSPNNIVQKLRTSALYVTFAHSLFPISEEQPPRSVHLAINEVRRFGDIEGFAVEEVLSFSYTLR